MAMADARVRFIDAGSIGGVSRFTYPKPVSTLASLYCLLLRFVRNWYENHQPTFRFGPSRTGLVGALVMGAVAPRLR